MDNPYARLHIKMVSNLRYEPCAGCSHHLTREPKKHITPVDVFFYVLEGVGIVEIGDEKKEVTKDELIDSPARIPHCWYNESDEAVRFLVVKVPRPTENTRLL